MISFKSRHVFIKCICKSCLNSIICYIVLMYLFLYDVNSVHLTNAKQKFSSLNNQLSNTSDIAEVLDSENRTFVPTSASFDICKLCWCSKKDTIDCRRDDNLDSLPIYSPKFERPSVTVM